MRPYGKLFSSHVCLLSFVALSVVKIQSDRLHSFRDSNVTYPALWRCGCECGGCASLKEMIHLQWETTASPTGDLLASPNFGIYDTTRFVL